MVTGLLLFVTRHLTAVRIDSTQGKPQICWGLPYLVRTTSAAADVATPAAGHYRDLSRCGLALSTHSAGAGYDGALDIRQPTGYQPGTAP